jgi:sugar lactone lactonase YvrE
VRVSPDGGSVYLGDDLAIVVFERRHTGALHYDDCYSDASRVDCRQAPKFSGADDLAVSPDGRSLYSAGYDSVGVFSRRVP